MGGVPEEVAFSVVSTLGRVGLVPFLGRVGLVPFVERVGVVGLEQKRWVEFPTGISGEVGVKVTNFTPQSQIYSHLCK